MSVSMVKNSSPARSDSYKELKKKEEREREREEACAGTGRDDGGGAAQWWWRDDKEKSFPGILEGVDLLRDGHHCTHTHMD